MFVFSALKSRGFSDIFALGLKFATNKSEFEEFANQVWHIGNGDYLRAIVATAYLLKEKQGEKLHELHTLDYVFGNLNGDGSALVHPIFLYFDDGENSITTAYKKHLADSEDMVNMFTDLQKLVFSDFQPLVKTINYYKLISYQGKSVRIFAKIDGENVRTVTKLKLYGNKKDSMKLLAFGKGLNLFGAKDGVKSIREIGSNELLFKNPYIENRNLSDIQKIGYIFGENQAREFYLKRCEELSSKDYREVPVTKSIDDRFDLTEIDNF